MFPLSAAGVSGQFLELQHIVHMCVTGAFGLSVVLTVKSNLKSHPPSRNHFPVHLCGLRLAFVVRVTWYSRDRRFPLKGRL